MKLNPMKKMRFSVSLFGGLLLACFFHLSAAAAPWPTKPIKIIVPFSPGSVQDALARSFSNELGVALGETVLVENKAGAGGTVGTGIVASHQPMATPL